MPDADFNRDDPALAAEIFQDLCPSERERKLILGQLLRSIVGLGGYVVWLSRLIA